MLKVREIMGLQEITAVPQTPGHVKGVINLRGKVDPGDRSAAEVRACPRPNTDSGPASSSRRCRESPGRC